MKTEELPYQTMEARDAHLGDVSTPVKAEGGKRQKSPRAVCLCPRVAQPRACAGLLMHTSYAHRVPSG